MFGDIAVTLRRKRWSRRHSVVVTTVATARVVTVAVSPTKKGSMFEAAFMEDDNTEAMT